MLPAKKLQLHFSSAHRTMLTQLCDAYGYRPVELLSLFVEGAYLGYQAEKDRERKGDTGAERDAGDAPAEHRPVDPTEEAGDPA